MPEIVKVQKERFPAVTFIGKRYTNADRGSDGGQWGEWFQNNWFAPLDALASTDVENGYVGLMGGSEAEDSFEYWIGCFCPENTAVPEGYACVNIPAGDVGICWIYGREDTGELYGEGPHNQCMEALQANNMAHCRDDFHGADHKWWWFFERYNCPRFTTADEHGKVILDYGMYMN